MNELLNKDEGLIVRLNLAFGELLDQIDILLKNNRLNERIDFDIDPSLLSQYNLPLIKGRLIIAHASSLFDSAWESTLDVSRVLNFLVGEANNGRTVVAALDGLDESSGNEPKFPGQASRPDYRIRSILSDIADLQYTTPVRYNA
jgi:hypothetical protein